MSKKKLTDAQREAIAFEYMDSWVTMEELAAKYGVDKSTISRVVSSSAVLDRLEARASAAARRASIRMKLSADEIARMTIEDARTEREDKFGYLSQNARRDVLDRAGVRASKEEKQEITIRMGEGLELGMPERDENEAGE